MTGGQKKSGRPSQNRRPFAEVSNIACSPAFATRSKRARASEDVCKGLKGGVVEQRKDGRLEASSAVETQESRLDLSCREGDVYTIQGSPVSLLGVESSVKDNSQQSSEFQDSCSPFVQDRNESDESCCPARSDGSRPIDTSLSLKESPAPLDNNETSQRDVRVAIAASKQPARVVEAGNAEVTPRRSNSITHSESTLHTPESSVRGSGWGESPQNNRAMSEGKIRVYERRKSEVHGWSSSMSCPQLRLGLRQRLSELKGSGAQGHKPCQFDISNKVGGKKSRAGASESIEKSLSEQFCQDRRAYFAEVDAFELQEEEEEEELDVAAEP